MIKQQATAEEKIQAGLAFLKARKGSTIVFSTRFNATGSNDAQALDKLLSLPLDSGAVFAERAMDLCRAARENGIGVQVIDDTTVSFTP